MQTSKKIILIVILIAALIISGYYRDFIFQNINALLQARDENMDYQLPLSLAFLSRYEYSTLNNLKWVLTLLFSGLYLIISLFTINVLFHEKKYLYITVISFVSIVFVSLLLIFIGYIYKESSEDMYEFARYLMGMIQSPLLLMILIPAFRLSEKERE